jgi:hypothetical protein
MLRLWSMLQSFGSAEAIDQVDEEPEHTIGGKHHVE